MGFSGLKRLFSGGGVFKRARLAPMLPLVEPSEPLEVTAPLPDEPGAPASVWTAQRIAVEEELWGAGYLTPGGESELLRFAVPLGLSAASSLLLLGAGAGGPAATLAGNLGVWTQGYEADPALAAHATQRIQRAGTALAKRASVGTWDPDAPAFRANFYHHALMIDAIRDSVVPVVLSAMTESLKPHGQVVIVETVAPTPLNVEDPAVKAWARLEGRKPVLPGPEVISRALGRLGFDIRVTEDASSRHIKLSVLGWKALLSKMGDAKPSPARAAAMVAEAELWTRRARLMEAGVIRQMRWHATHKGTAAKVYVGGVRGA